MLVNERPENRRNPEFDNEASLREARKKLPFELFLEQHGSAESCLFCQTQGSVKVITRPVVTGKISRATIEAVNAIEIVRVVEPRGPLKGCEHEQYFWICPVLSGPRNFCRRAGRVPFGLRQSSDQRDARLSGCVFQARRVGHRLRRERRAIGTPGWRAGRRVDR